MGKGAVRTVQKDEDSGENRDEDDPGEPADGVDFGACWRRALQRAWRESALIPTEIAYGVWVGGFI